jgi:hypothetical protein
MNITPHRPSCFTWIALALGLVLAALPAAAAGAKSLPVTTTIEKGEPGPEFGGPYVLVVKNTGDAALKLKAVIAQSVVSHNRPKTIERPDHEIAAGGTWKITDLAVEDKVTLSAPGHDKLEVVVKAAK